MKKREARCSPWQLFLDERSLSRFARANLWRFLLLLDSEDVEKVEFAPDEGAPPAGKLTVSVTGRMHGGEPATATYCFAGEDLEAVRRDRQLNKWLLGLCKSVNPKKSYLGANAYPPRVKETAQLLNAAL